MSVIIISCVIFCITYIQLETKGDICFLTADCANHMYTWTGEVFYTATKHEWLIGKTALLLLDLVQFCWPHCN